MIAILGAGAFGSALALVLARSGHDVTLWARDPSQAGVAGVAPVGKMRITGDINACRPADAALLAVPMQALDPVLGAYSDVLDGQTLVACCKGMDLTTGEGPTAVIRRRCASAVPAVISGPGFATDLAAGLPTAMTLAHPGPGGADLQTLLSGDTLRLYLSPDLVGVETGGAVKNVIAIACGIVVGAGLGESARAALMTRGYAEMLRFAGARGADPATLSGLSGLGDLVLTCVSRKSRNFRHGLALGAGRPPNPSETVEGVATTRALADAALREGIDMPVTSVLARVLAGRLDVADAMKILLSRPLKLE